MLDLLLALALVQPALPPAAQGTEGQEPPSDPRWTEEEIEARWAQDAPPGLEDDLEKPIRTEHYLILGNSSGGKAFAKKMEECYEIVQEIFPFEEPEGAKLMPVLLFRTPEQYYEFYAKIAQIPIEAARRTKGHAWRDYYATWYEAPNDPVHVHEATHQIFHNRLGLYGGGSWYQEGVAEYVETSHRERKAFARKAARKGRFVPFREFVQIDSLVGRSADERVDGGSQAADNYKQAASIIEFLRDSKYAPDKFDEFLHAMGKVPRGDLEAIEGVFQKVYGVGLDGIEKAWVDYWKKT